MKSVLGAAVLMSLTASAGLADTPSRCSLLGQMAGSVWLEMIQALGDGKTEQVNSAITRLDALTASYERVGCDIAALNGALECVLTEDSSAGPRVQLRQCMAQAGISGE